MTSFVRTQELSHEIGARGQFGVLVTSAAVELRATDGGTAHVRATFEIRASSDAEADEIFERIGLRVNAASGLFEVAERKDGSGGVGSLKRLFGGSGAIDSRVDATVPRTAEIRFEGVSSDVTSIGFGGQQAYRTVSGDLVLDRVSGDLRVKGVSSDVSVRCEEPLRTLELETVSGDASIVAPRIGQARLVTVSGDVELETSLDEGPVHRVETVSGDLSLGIAGGLTLEVRGVSTDVEVRLPHRIEGSRDRRRYVVADGGPNLMFSSMSGDVEVHTTRRGPVAAPPTPPTPPTAPTPPVPATPPTPPRMVVVSDDEQLAVLRALERGEIDVDEATRRLAGEGDSDV